MKREKLALVDFDKTLISIDSLVYILKQEHWYLRPELLVAGIRLALNMMLGSDTFITRSKFKYLILKYYGEMSEARKNHYFDFLRTKLNHNIIRQITEAKFEKIVIASASEKSLIKEVLENVMNVDAIIANDSTNLPILSESFKTNWGKEKVENFKRRYPDYKQYHITVYTDSNSDKPIMDIANESIMV